MVREPDRLKKGKRFHTEIQKLWCDEAEGSINPELSLVKSTGRNGRVDILVDPDESTAAVVEIKNSDWDRMLEKNVRRNVKRQARKIWSCLESELLEGKTVCPGVIFPKKPVKPGRMSMVEELFMEEFIPVVWQDESIPERRSRESVT